MTPYTKELVLRILTTIVRVMRVFALSLILFACSWALVNRVFKKPPSLWGDQSLFNNDSWYHLYTHTVPAKKSYAAPTPQVRILSTSTERNRFTPEELGIDHPCAADLRTYTYGSVFQIITGGCYADFSYYIRRKEAVAFLLLYLGCVVVALYGERFFKKKNTTLCMSKE